MNNSTGQSEQPAPSSSSPPPINNVLGQIDTVAPKSELDQGDLGRCCMPEAVKIADRDTNIADLPYCPKCGKNLGAGVTRCWTKGCDFVVPPGMKVIPTHENKISEGLTSEQSLKQNGSQPISDDSKLSQSQIKQPDSNASTETPVGVQIIGSVFQGLIFGGLVGWGLHFFTPLIDLSPANPYIRNEIHPMMWKIPLLAAVFSSSAQLFCGVKQNPIASVAGIVAYFLTMLISCLCFTKAPLFIL